MHINNNELKDFENNTMSTQEIIAFLQHMEQCDYCLEQMLDQQQTDQTTQAPAYLKGTILNRANSLEIQAEKTALHVEHKVNHFFQGLRTMVGIALALIMLFSLGESDLFTSQNREAFSQEATTQNRIQSSLSFISSGVTDGLSDGSQKFINCLNSISTTITNGGN